MPLGAAFRATDIQRCRSPDPSRVFAGASTKAPSAKKVGFPAVESHTTERETKKLVFYCLLGGEIKPTSQQGRF
jgi:hypothetical protein